MASCSRTAERHGPRRLAILPFENLTGDASLDWAGPGAQQVIVEQLTGTDILPFGVQHRADAYGARADRILSGYLARENGRLRVKATITDLASSRNTAEPDVVAGDVLVLASAVSKQLTPEARPYATGNEEALKAFVESRYEDAVRLDPAYGPAYSAWVRALAARGDREGAVHAVALAQQQGDRLPPLDRARLAYFAAVLNGDTKAQTEALAEIANLSPGDIEVLQNLGRQALRARRFSAAAGWYRKATEAEPENGILWNEVGYALAYARNFDGAFDALRRYAKVSPDEPNPADSMGEVAFYSGRFEDAEKYFLEAWNKNHAFLNGAPLLKAAYARLMVGDLTRADEYVGRYLGERTDPASALRRAQWEYMTGRKKQAIERLGPLAASGGDAASEAHSQLALWKLDGGDLNSARQEAMAAGGASNGHARALADICRFLAQPPGPPAEWRTRADRAFAPAPQLRPAALNYALLFGKHFADAAVELRKVFDQTPPENAGPVKVLLAWALIEAGKTGEARDYLDTWPIPLGGVEPEFEFLTFPRIFRLHAAVLDRDGKKPEAAAAIALYKKYGGG